MDNIILDVKNLTKRFGKFTAVDNLSFSIKDGEILGLLGPNGAGKTTTIQMLLGVMEPTEGEIIYFDKPFKKHREEILQDVNFSSTYISFPWNLTVWENLMVFAYLYQVTDKKKRINKLLEAFEAQDLKDKNFYMLSAGEKTKVFLIKAFLNYPKILLLDEPTASLDPDIAKKIREFLKKEKKEFNVSMLFTSHNMTEVEEMCDRIIFLNHGKIIAQGTPSEIAKNIKNCKLQLMISQGSDELIKYLNKKGLQAKMDKPYLNIDIPEKQVSNILSEITRKGFEYEEINIEKPSLEDFFLKVVKENEISKN
ncbi:MAG: ABC transporter ATP-binding protein [bacterium]|nr:ABC transporter ATP-binding protein [bacterium]